MFAPHHQTGVFDSGIQIELLRPHDPHLFILEIPEHRLERVGREDARVVGDEEKVFARKLLDREIRQARMVEDSVVVQRSEGRKTFAQACKGVLDMSVELSDFDHHDFEIVVTDLLIEARYTAFDHISVVHGV